MGAYIKPENYFVSYIFMTDRVLDKAKKSGLIEELTEYHKALLEKRGYPSEGIKDCMFASFEDCKRKANGNWYCLIK